MKEMAGGTLLIDQRRRGRFEALLCGEGTDYDQVILETHGCAVAPTLGSIIPNWLLIVPRHNAISFREWHAGSGFDPLELIGEVLSELDVDRGRAIWFEHGPSIVGSTVGCGVDHAHIHVLIDPPFRFDVFASTAFHSAPIHWRWTEPTRVYQDIPEATSYLAAGSGDKAIVAESVERAGSQFFRRIVARLVGRPDQWDYRVHSHLANVKRTLSALGSPRVAAL